MEAAVLGFFAERDEFVTPEAVSKLSNTLQAAGKEFDFTTYPDTDYAFFNRTRKEVYNQEAANKS
jgi:carboxymethylenebutenolidase